jgi:CHAT domain-containing protein
MDLRATEIVSVVACESGVAQVQDGEKITGLREAFFLAGARAVTMSLWEVPAHASADQMGEFYGRWLNDGLPRYRAFHESQLKALQEARARGDSGHPFWWAGFIYAGDPGDLPVAATTRPSQSTGR